VDTIEAKANATSTAEEAPLPRRDLLILPLISICTIVLCLIAAESLAEYFFASQELNPCMVPDPVHGAKFKPNCTVRMKAAEGPWVTSSYNDCGYRTKEPCGPKPAGTTRIALLGSSSSEGYYNSYDQTFASLTAAELTKVLKRPVEVQNLGRAGCNPICALNRVDEALALKPDFVMLAMSNFDMQNMETTGAALQNAKAIAPIAPTYKEKVFSYLKEKKAVVAVTHFLTEDNPGFARVRVTTYLTNGDLAGYLWKPFPAAWNDRIQLLDGLLESAEAKCRNAHVPFVLIEIPTFQQVSLMGYQNLPAGVDPYAFTHSLQQLALQHQMQFINTTDAFTKPNDKFYVVDGHMNANGNAVVARVVVEHLLAEQMPALAPQGKALAGTSEASWKPAASGPALIAER
jgi:hypothetical protein